MSAFNAAATAPTGYNNPASASPTQDGVRFSRMMSDIVKGAWQASAGTDCYAMLNEATADGSTYIQTSTPTLGKFALGPVIDPQTSINQVVYYEAHSAQSGNLTVRLLQGNTVIATRVHTTLPTVVTVHELRLTAAECDAITDYRNLFIELAVI